MALAKSWFQYLIFLVASHMVSSLVFISHPRIVGVSDKKPSSLSFYLKVETEYVLPTRKIVSLYLNFLSNQEQLIYHCQCCMRRGIYNWIPTWAMPNIICKVSAKF
jgi:hypothetical protein